MAQTSVLGDRWGSVSGKILGSGRASLSFALVVFVATLIQVLATPLIALLEGTTEWGLIFSEPVIVILLFVGCAAQAGALMLSDRWPRLTVALVVCVYLAMAIGLTIPSWLIGMYPVIALAVFLLATRLSFAESMLWALGVSAVCVGMLCWWILRIGTAPEVAVGFVLGEAANLAAPTIGGAALGSWWAAQVCRVAAAREAAEVASREHDARVVRAQAWARARIAQELHDVAGQHLAGLMTLSDAALAVAPTHPQQALELVRDVRDEGRFAAASLAGALADLRAVGTRQLETTRGLQRAPELVQYWERRGMNIHFFVAGDVTGLPPVVSATAYRSLQEALTNAAKHAPSATVKVRIALTPGILQVTVENDAPTGPPHSLSGLDLGWGVAGMTERIELLGGTLKASATPSGGWLLSFTIPAARVT